MHNQNTQDNSRRPFLMQIFAFLIKCKQAIFLWVHKGSSNCKRHTQKVLSSNILGKHKPFGPRWTL
jgi:hypothetical protein